MVGKSVDDGEPLRRRTPGRRGAPRPSIGCHRPGSTDVLERFDGRPHEHRGQRRGPIQGPRSLRVAGLSGRGGRTGRRPRTIPPIDESSAHPRRGKAFAEAPPRGPTGERPEARRGSTAPPRYAIASRIELAAGDQASACSNRATRTSAWELLAQRALGAVEKGARARRRRPHGARPQANGKGPLRRRAGGPRARPSARRRTPLGPPPNRARRGADPLPPVSSPRSRGLARHSLDSARRTGFWRRQLITGHPRGVFEPRPARPESTPGSAWTVPASK